MDSAPVTPSVPPTVPASGGLFHTLFEHKLVVILAILVIASIVYMYMTRKRPSKAPAKGRVAPSVKPTPALVTPTLAPTTTADVSAVEKFEEEEDAYESYE